MNKVEQVNQLHEQAMLLAEEAFLAKRAKDNATAQNLYQQAYQLEQQAALLMITDYHIEPTRSVLFKGAANLALNIENHKEAERMIRFALSGNPPSQIEQELHALLLEIKGHITTTKRGINLPPLYKSIPARLKQVSDALIEQGIVENMTDIAREMNISTPTLAKYCSSAPSAPTSLPIVFLFAEKYHVSSDYIVHGKGNMFRIQEEGFILKVPKSLQTPIKNYLEFFKDYVEATRGKEIIFDTRRDKDSLVLVNSSNTNFTLLQLSELFEEYVSFTQKKSEEWLFNFEKPSTTIEADILRFKMENEIRNLRIAFQVAELESQIPNLSNQVIESEKEIKRLKTEFNRLKKDNNSLKKTNEYLKNLNEVLNSQISDSINYKTLNYHHF